MGKSTATRGDLEAFYDLIGRDPELLQLEFEDFIAAEWPEQPPERPDATSPPRPTWPTRGPGRRWRIDDGARPASGLRPRSVRPYPRSPPRHVRSRTDERRYKTDKQTT